MCHKRTRLSRWSSLAIVSAGALLGQTSPEAKTPVWRKIGNSAVDLPLASPATGPVDTVWFSSDESRLYAKTRSGMVFETADFENWMFSASPPAPPADNAAAVERAPAANVRLVAAPSQPGRVFALGRYLFRSDDGGQSWTNLTAYKAESIIGSGQHSLAVSRTNPDQIVVANDFGVWRSMDGGLSWSGLNQTLPNLGARKILATPNGTGGARLLVDGYGPVEWQPGNPSGWLPLENATTAPDIEARRTYSAAVGSQVVSYGVSGDTVYAGTADGNIYVSFERGQPGSFQKTTRTGLGGPVEGLFVDGTESRVALAAVTGQGQRILRTTNSGNFWDDLSQNLPPGAAHAVTADRAAGAVYAATDAGIFYARADLENANPAAPSWVSLTGRIPNARGYDVKLDAAGNQLYAALDGYGAFVTTPPHRLQTVRLVNAADFSNRPAAPGSLVSVLGARVASAKAGELNFPVLAASDGESQIQVPFEASAATVPLTLDTAGSKLTIGLPVQSVAPAIFVSRDGAAMIQDAATGLMLDPRNAAHSNARIQIFATGMGRVRPDWPTGTAAPLEQQPPVVAANVRAYVDRAEVQVTQATLAPGYVGLYLIELQLPAIVNAGPVELFITADNQESNRVQIYLEP